MKIVGLLGTVGLLLGGCHAYYTGPVSDHFDGQRFFNPGKPLEKSFGRFLKWRLTGERKPWPPYRDLAQYDSPPTRVEGDELRVSMVGHATLLIQTNGLNILTDPIWSERASPLSWLGPKRIVPPGIRFAELPPIDVVLISHNHYDHLDLETISRLWRRYKPRIIVPLGNDWIIHHHDDTIRSESYDWGDEVRISDQVTIALEPMHHWSAWSTGDHNEALWAAFIISTPGGNIYFVGDSGYGAGDYFRAAQQKYREFRLALLPIGAYTPRWFMAYGHMDPREAVLAFHELGEPWVVPTHYQVFPLADDGYDDPMKDLARVLSGDRAAEKSFHPLLPGEAWLVPEKREVE